MKSKPGRGGSTKASKGKTDWRKLAALPDRDIQFTKDAPRTSPEDWANAVAHRGLPLPAKQRGSNGHNGCRDRLTKHASTKSPLD